MTFRIHSAAIVVSDQDAAVAFYTEVLGWQVREDAMMGPEHRFLVVVPPGHFAGLVLGQPHIMGRQVPGPENARDAGINLVTDDLVADHAKLSELGVVFDMPPTPMPWGGHGGTFLDPDGNRFFITDGGDTGS